MLVDSRGARDRPHGFGLAPSAGVGRASFPAPHTYLDAGRTVDAMRLSETRDVFVERLTFPAEREAVLDAVGSVELDAPWGDPESVGEVLARADDESFGSADELYDTLLTYVGDQYIGRKFYDDRGSQNAIDSEEVSF